MLKLGEQRLVGVVAACGAALALVVACSSSSSDDTSATTTGGSSGAVGSGNASGTSSGGKGGSVGSSGSANGGTSAGGSSSAGTTSGGTGPATGGGGATNGGTANGGAANGGTAGGGAANGGAANGGTAGGGAANGGTAAGGAAGDTGMAGDTGSAGAPPFTPIAIPLLNAGFETGTGNIGGTVMNWQTSGDPASYLGYDDGSGAHSGYGRLAMWRMTPAYKVSTFQTVNGLANGTYTLAAWLDGAATGINALYIYATGYNSSSPSDQMKTDITPGQTYSQYSLTNIIVNSGTLTVGVYADATANTWVNLDDITLTRVE